MLWFVVTQQLTELELTQLDDLYKLFNPSREDNARLIHFADYLQTFAS